MATTLGVLNPLTYRGYVYDRETQLYYLQSRYYNPEVGRFLNADIYTSTGQGLLGNNMFAYCLNNPVRYADHSGELVVEISIATVVAYAGIALCAFALAHIGAKLVITIVEYLTEQWAYSSSTIMHSAEETLPQQGLVEGDPEAPPVDAGKQGKHVPGHNNYDEGKSAWPEGQNGVQQTQEAWQNGVPDPKKPDGSVRIGIASDGTIVRVHMDGRHAIHGYPLFYFLLCY